MSRPAVFLDRDGTINVEVGYLSTPDRLALLPGAAEGIARLNRTGFMVVVVTNQSGLARGFFDAATLEAIHARLEEMLAEHHAHVDAFYYCPHHPDDGCACRKPTPTMFQRAAAELGFDLGRSVLVGDTLTDIAPAAELGCRSVLVLTGYGREHAQRLGAVRPDHVAENLGAAVEWILSTMGDELA